MARPQRPSIADGHYHITVRGRDGRQIFHDPEDSYIFLEVLAAACRRFRWSCRAYCLLPDGYRLVLHTRVANLSRGMRQLNGLYCEAFNRRHGTHGPLFQGRYKAILFEPEAVLAEVCRSVLLAPRHAELVEDPAKWRWSSYRQTLEGEASDWLKPPTGPAAALQAFVSAEHDDQALWRQVEGQVFLGSAAFVQAIKDRLAGTAATPRRGRDLAGLTPKPLESFTSRCAEPGEAMARAYLAGGYTLAQIANHFAVHQSTVSRAVKRYEQRGVTAL